VLHQALGVDGQVAANRRGGGRQHAARTGLRHGLSRLVSAPILSIIDAVSSIPRRELGLRDAMALVVGLVIGAGIFKAPSLVAANAGSVEWMFAAWVLGGLVSFAGALCYAELATTFPNTGGDYHFLFRAYGRTTAFLFGWARFSVIVTGSIALLAFIFGDYMHAFFPLVPDAAAGSAIYAAVAIVVLSWLNLRGTSLGTSAQAWLTLLEVAGLALVAVSALALPAAPITPDVAAKSPAPAAFGLAMVFVLLTYGGWNEAAYVSGELKEVRRDMVRALSFSLLLITALYLLVVWAYWHGLGLDGMARSQAVAADLLERAFGSAGSQAISLIVAISTLTSINGTMIVGARSNYAVGRDWPRLRAFGAWDGARNTPAYALRVQCVLALVLVGIGMWIGSGFKSMVEFTAPVFWLFFLLVGASLFVLRVREPRVERPFRVPLYPLVPAVFCASCAYMLWSSLSYVYNQELGGFNAAWVGVAVLLVGVVVLAFLRPSNPVEESP
jgi:amino acid transporter